MCCVVLTLSLFSSFNLFSKSCCLFFQVFAKQQPKLPILVFAKKETKFLIRIWCLVRCFLFHFKIITIIIINNTINYQLMKQTLALNPSPISRRRGTYQAPQVYMFISSSLCFCVLSTCKNLYSNFTDFLIFYFFNLVSWYIWLIYSLCLVYMNPVTRTLFFH